MGISLYFRAERSKALSASERKRLQQLVDVYQVSALEAARAVRKNGRLWESLFVDASVESPVIWQGSAGLPMDQRAIMAALEHWATLLGKARAELKGAKWHVHVDDHVLNWIEADQAYDLYS